MVCLGCYVAKYIAVHPPVHCFLLGGTGDPPPPPAPLFPSNDHEAYLAAFTKQRKPASPEGTSPPATTPQLCLKSKTQIHDTRRKENANGCESLIPRPLHVGQVGRRCRSNRRRSRLFPSPSSSVGSRVPHTPHQATFSLPVSNAVCSRVLTILTLARLIRATPGLATGAAPLTVLSIVLDIKPLSHIPRSCPRR